MTKLYLYFIVLSAIVLSGLQVKNSSTNFASTHTCSSHNQTSGNHVCHIAPSPDPTILTQPDGTTLTAKILGNRIVNYLETTDGYTIIEDKDGYYKFAERGLDGDLIATNTLATDPGTRTATDKDFLNNISKNLKYEGKTLEQKKEAFAQKQMAAQKNGPAAVFPSTGTHKAILLLIDYPDQPFSHTNTEFNNLCNLNGYSVNGQAGSFKDFYYDVSYGNLTVNTDVLGWYTASQNKAYYGDESTTRATDLVREAVDAAEAAGVDFSQYDGDGDGLADVIMVIHSGRGQEESGVAADIWSHRWALVAGGNHVNYDGVWINDYIIQPEKYGPAQITNIGVLCHEFGHALGLPDLYDTDGSSEGIGRWCLMSSGSWNNQGRTPAHLSAWCKQELGWATPTVLTGSGSIPSMTYVDNAALMYRINTNNPTEYFLIENRQQFGWDASLPGEGLAIWHIDTDKTSLWPGSNSVNNTDNNMGVHLEQADGNEDLNNDVNRGDAGDLFPGATNNTTFDCVSTPASSNYDGTNTGIAIATISESGPNVSFDYTDNCSVTSASLDCSSAISLTCGTPYSGSTTGAVANADTYNCSTTDAGGPEIVHTITTSQTLDITATLSNLTADLNVYILSSCDESQCLAYGDERATYENAPAGTYYIVVDGGTGVTGDYDLTVDCFCRPGGGSSGEWIQSVELAGIKNNSGNNGGYLLFNNIVFDLFKGNDETILLTPGFNTSAYNEYWRVWIDWNSDNDFEDANELVFDPGAASSLPQTGTISIPSNVGLGTYRMRVAMKFNTAPLPCEMISFGDVEDYYINILNPEATPYVENFDSAVAPELPQGAAATDSNDDGQQWITESGSGINGTNSIKINTNSTVINNDWFFLPAVELTAGTDYALKFKYKSDASNPERLEIFTGTERSVSGMTKRIFNDDGFTYTDWQEMCVRFTVSATGSYFFGFHGYSAASSNFIVIDEVDVREDVEASALIIEDNANDDACTTYSINGVHADNSWFDITDENGHIVASVNPMGQNLGTVTVEMKDASGVLEAGASHTGTAVKLLPRFFNFTSSKFAPGTTFGGGVKVRLYYKNEELTAFNADTKGSGKGTATNWNMSDLNYTHYSGSNEDCDPTNNDYSGAFHNDHITSFTTSIVGTEDHCLEFSVNHFSEFIGHEPSGGALPVELVDFYAEKSNSAVQLYWTTATEENNAGFEVQRSMDGMEWEVLTFVEGNGTTVEVQNYEWEDNNPKEGLNYYRLKQVDFDGTMDLSDVVFVDMGKREENQISVFPNPIASGNASVMIEVDNYQEAQLQVFSATGKQVNSESVDLIPGNNRLTVSVDDLEEGLYFVYVKIGAIGYNAKLIVQ